MHIGKKIRFLRVTRGLTQQELSSKINKERPLISHIERTGKANHYTLQKICKALGVTIDELENLSNDPKVLYGPKSHPDLKAENEKLKIELAQKDQLISTLRELVRELKKNQRSGKR